MLSPERFYGSLIDCGVGLFAGVPDSLLKDFCAYVTDHAPPGRHIITANEGSAVALAMGHHLATGAVGLVYMQNSGVGNTVNPLTSLADPAIYGIPMVLVVGWRGEPGKKDEPQHVKMGQERSQEPREPQTVAEGEETRKNGEPRSVADKKSPRGLRQWLESAKNRVILNHRSEAGKMQRKPNTRNGPWSTCGHNSKS